MKKQRKDSASAIVRDLASYEFEWWWLWILPVLPLMLAWKLDEFYTRATSLQISKRKVKKK